MGGLINSPTAMWTIPAENNDISISISSIGLSTSVLMFNPLKTTHGGAYICNGALTTPASHQPLIISKSEQVTVQSKCDVYIHNII